MASMRLFNPGLFNPVSPNGEFNTGLQTPIVPVDNAYAIQHAIGPTTVKNSWIWEQLRLGALQRQLKDKNFYLPKELLKLFADAAAKPEAYLLYDNTPIFTSWFELGRITKRQYVLLAAAERQRLSRVRPN